ncbi:hypothetical protein H072_1905 [Dactylellina haptotyla CBS 200.50]|uniref:Uncharacterized protein n=1 Tax=Dactylellina haptotyla (strain CBS 200.50) TaxID=1284197 RepID=S8BX53_DACHA|nr:hypothetical protein H072_1905 [Dactylellina haptotyla CBS 200.50]
MDPINLNPLPLEFQFANTPDCIQDCMPILLSARYCSFQFPHPTFDNVTAYNRCLCDNPYILPLTTGLQCAFLCGHDSRAEIIDFIQGPLGCGAYPPWNKIAMTIPGPETFAPNYPPAERWWRKWRDGERFGIILGCVLAAMIVVSFIYGGITRIIELVKARKKS